MTDIHFISRADGSRLALTRQAPPRFDRSVLVVHGATFPTSLSAAYRIEGRSWFDELCAAGFETWGLDFQGFGPSDPFPGTGHATPGDAIDAAAQLALALEFIRRESPAASLALIAHSWGTAPAGLLLSQRPGQVDRAVFYGPIVAAESRQALPGQTPAFLEVTREAQWAAFAAGVPEGTEPPVTHAEFDRWAEAYLRSDSRAVPSVRVPSGPAIDIERARRGHMPYDPGLIETPTLVVRGSWDAVTTEADSIRFFHALTRSRGKQLSWISGGTHRMHLERSRFELFSAVEGFLEKRRLSASGVRTRPPASRAASPRTRRSTRRRAPPGTSS